MSRLVRMALPVTFVLAAAPLTAAAVLPRLKVEPSAGGTNSTIRVRITVPQTRNYTVSVKGPCTSATDYPWTQTLQLPGRDFSTGRAVLQFARPIGGWCSGRFR